MIHINICFTQKEFEWKIEREREKEREREEENWRVWVKKSIYIVFSSQHLLRIAKSSFSLTMIFFQILLNDPQDKYDRDWVQYTP